MHTIAVYGTLRKGYGNHRLLRAAKPLGNALVTGYAMHSLGGFPAITPGVGTVTVELFEVDDQALTACDHLEGHPNWYARTPATTTTGKACEIYVMPASKLDGRLGHNTLIASGDWKTCRRS